MNKLFFGLLFSASFLLATLVFAQNSEHSSSSSGVLVSPPIQEQGSNEDSSGQPKHHADVNSDTSSQNNQEAQAKSGQIHKSWIPSPHAIAACQDKTEGATCEMVTPRGTRPGICVNTQDKKYLFCKRSHKKAHSHGERQAHGS